MQNSTLHFSSPHRFQILKAYPHSQTIRTNSVRGGIAFPRERDSRAAILKVVLALPPFSLPFQIPLKEIRGEIGSTASLLPSLVAIKGKRFLMRLPRQPFKICI